MYDIHMFINRSQLGQTGPSCPTGGGHLGQMSPMGPRPNWANYLHVCIYILINYIYNSIYINYIYNYWYIYNYIYKGYI